MKMRRVLLVIGMLLTGISGLLAQQELSFQMLRGSAGFFRNGGATWLELGPEPITVRVGDKIRTGENSRGDLHFPDGSVVRLKSACIMTYLGNSLQMQIGEALFRFQKQNRSMQIVTPMSMLGILGTVFDVRVDGYGKTRVRVFEGLVSVRAHFDQRKRQLVLQKGMQTTVANKSFVEDQPKRFDPEKVEKEKNEASERARMDTPERSALPPIREALPMTMETVGPDGKTQPFVGPEKEREEEGTNIPEEGSLRDNMSFFENLRHHTLREYLNYRAYQEKIRKESLSGASPKDRNSPWKPLLPKEMTQPSGPEPLNPDKIRDRFSDLAPYGPEETRSHDQKEIREEISRTQMQLQMLQAEISDAQSEARRLQAMLGQSGQPKSSSNPPGTSFPVSSNPPSGMPTRLPIENLPKPDSSEVRQPTDSASRESVINRIRLFQERLRILSDQQQKLMQRIHDLRNRLN